MLSASVQALPSGETLRCRASSPVSPSSARPEPLSWKIMLAVSAALALLSFSRWLVPAWVKRLASDDTARRLVRSAATLMPNLASPVPPTGSTLDQAPDAHTAISLASSTQTSQPLCGVTKLHPPSMKVASLPSLPDQAPVAEGATTYASPAAGLPGGIAVVRLLTATCTSWSSSAIAAL